MPEIPYRENPNPSYRGEDGDQGYLGFVGHAVGTPADRPQARGRRGIGFGQELEPGLEDLRAAIDEAVEAIEALAVDPGQEVYHRPIDVQRGLEAAERLRECRP